MVYAYKNVSTSFTIPLLEFVTINPHGYLFKATPDYNQGVAEYFIPNVNAEDIRFTYFEHNFRINAGQYTLEIYEYNTGEDEPTDETGLNRLAIVRLNVEETDTNSIYI
jgi:hypothetical protein